MTKPKMCSYSGGVTKISSPKDAPNHVKCPICGRRLRPRLYDSHFHILKAEADWFYKMPPHKVKGWWKRRNK